MAEKVVEIKTNGGATWYIDASIPLEAIKVIRARLLRALKENEAEPRKLGLDSPAPTKG